MSNAAIGTILGIAENFGAIAMKVNESSKIRKHHADTSLEYIGQAAEICEGLIKEFEDTAQINSELLSQNTIVQNTCENLRYNLGLQRVLIESARGTLAVVPPFLAEIESYCTEFQAAIDDVEKNVREIIGSNNRLYVMDKFIISKKKSQFAFVCTLRMLAEITKGDATKAIEWSHSNLNRGLAMVEKIQNIPTLINGKNIDALNDLAYEANRGWNVAAGVNDNSRSQLLFSEKVNDFARKMTTESNKILDMVVEKHNAFEAAIQVLTVITVIIAIKFVKYLDIEKIIDDITYGSDEQYFLQDLVTYIRIACEEVRGLNALNYHITDWSHLNNEIEARAMKRTKKENELYGTILKEVEAMTEATAFPIKGSSENIKNGQDIEQEIRNIIAML
jgi:hypothetical protein